jgi:thiamine kinase-like enzyme
MAAISTGQLREYLRHHPLPGAPQITELRALATGGSAQRFAVLAGPQWYLVKCYPTAAAEAAQRETTGLRLAGPLGLSATLTAADEGAGGLGGPVVIAQRLTGAPLGTGQIGDDDADDWLFLLLTLHHLPPDRVTLASSLSPDLRTWWQRVQPAWDACRVAYVGPRYQPLLDALARLHTIAGVRVETHRTLWSDLVRRPCHGNPVSANVWRTADRLVLVEWDGFGLGDPALDLGRATVLGVLEGALDPRQYARFLSQYLDGMRDLADPTIAQRIEVFASVLPLGFAFFLLSALGPSGTGSARPSIPSTLRASTLEQVARALGWVQSALGIQVGVPGKLLAPLSGAA